jgi:RND family efflux transporter MFP subunit
VSDARVLLLAVALAGACGGNRYVPPPPPEVSVANPVSREITTWGEFTGHTQAIVSVDLRARVAGFLTEIHFVPGSVVKQNDLLFVIEPGPYLARLQAAQADLEGKDAQYHAAEAQLEITRAIYERKAGARTDLVAREQARDLAKAAVAGAKAALEQAKIDYSYTHIYAPVTGRIDRNLVDLGNLVGAGDATLLATIVQDDPIFAYFDVSERALLEYRELQRKGQTVAGQGDRNKAFMGLITETEYPHEGVVDFADNRVDPATGTIEARAVFPNPDHRIVPGLFVRLRLPRTREQAVLVPDVALSQDLAGHFVLTVDDTDTVQHRRVQLGELVGQLRVVSEGLAPTDRVIVNGLQRAHPGAKVKPKLVPVTEGAPEPPVPGAARAAGNGAP